LSDLVRWLAWDPPGPASPAENPMTGAAMPLPTWARCLRQPTRQVIASAASCAALLLFEPESLLTAEFSNDVGRSSFAAVQDRIHGLGTRGVTGRSSWR
jgi:hypothetical protein